MCDVTTVCVCACLCVRVCVCVVTLCHKLQRTATHCHTRPLTATHRSRDNCITTHCNALQYTATHGNTRQRTATHGNTLTSPLAAIYTSRQSGARTFLQSSSVFPLNNCRYTLEICILMAAFFHSEMYIFEQSIERVLLARNSGDQ